jgi:hypothetical protein
MSHAVSPVSIFAMNIPRELASGLSEPGSRYGRLA